MTEVFLHIFAEIINDKRIGRICNQFYSRTSTVHAKEVRKRVSVDERKRDEDEENWEKGRKPLNNY